MKMNKYQKALNTIGDTLTYYMIRRDTNLLPSENEIYDAMSVLTKLVSKSNSQYHISASERIPEKKYESTLFAEAVAHCEKIVINGKVIKGK